ncbi:MULTISPECIES: aminotransferase class V-fold PLP-dependent enzyme [unclassified Spirosoma]|uniref:aminotransferase class V-fold PLP-dependent enzyme n=1 Tax=unclassified Spirosoma TaxID=2621999 RepID=UPI000964314D|nr:MULTISPECIES: aminotransferase class V-fold PLP-dependent enzyme [unclassified Spirosoma]MBN8820745.1 aminotransferase class V-fold PLP-dependent enzyme [Spirosoma sp.]OJW70722.1 MAG: capreomycin acetyltransferase [Spirosoma sp. 48-14]
MQIQTTSFPDLARLRADTPGCYDHLFMNSAGASLMPTPVVTAMMEYLQQETELGGYEVERLRSSQIARFYDETARLLNTKPGNIAYAYSATDAGFQVLSAIPFRAGDTILTTTNDYVSNQLAFLSMQQRLGIRLLRINDLPNGDLDLTHLDELIRTHRPTLIAITHIPTNSGLVLPAEEVGRLCRQYGVWYLLDAAQSVGQLPLDVAQIQPDFLIATGRKFLRGPRNTGFLYVSDRVLEAGLAPLLVDRRAASWTAPDAYTLQTGARRFEPQEISLLSVGLAEAVRYANEITLDAISQQNQQLMHRLRTGLQQIDGLTLLDRGSQQSNLLTFHTTRQSLATLDATLRREGVIFTVQHAGAALIDFQRKGIDWLIRLSPHYFNTEEEIDAVVDVIGHAVH